MAMTPIKNYKNFIKNDEVILKNCDRTIGKMTQNILLFNISLSLKKQNAMYSLQKNLSVGLLIRTITTITLLISLIFMQKLETLIFFYTKLFPCYEFLYVHDARERLSSTNRSVKNSMGYVRKTS
jgi:hypothetical protein